MKFFILTIIFQLSICLLACSKNDTVSDNTIYDSLTVDSFTVDSLTVDSLTVDPDIDNQPEDSLTLTGPYLGQTVPENTPVLFARDIINTGRHTRDIAMTPDGQEIYFSTNNENHSYNKIYVTKIDNGAWTQPQPASFSESSSIGNGEPFITSDGTRMYFVSTRLPDGSEGSDYNIWYMDRDGNNWGTPQEIGSPINSAFNEFFPSVTNNGTVYFTRTIPSDGTYIFRSRLVNGEHEEPEKLGNEINSTKDQFNAFIAPDESFIIVPNGQRSDSYGGTDYYICFRKEDDSWTNPINLGNQVNSPFGREWSASLSQDGKYLFFMSDRGPDSPGVSKIFWIDANFLKDLNPG